MASTSIILGTGSSFPLRSVSNDELAKTVETSDSWIRERTGIGARFIAGPQETASSLGAEALAKAMEAASRHRGLSLDEVRKSLDLILTATVSEDQVMPNTASLIQARLGLSTLRGENPCAALDISAACSGFVYGLDLADALLASGRYRMIGLIGTEVLSRLVNWSDRSTCILFGDGAGAAILARRDALSPSTANAISPEGPRQSRFLTHQLFADGTLGDLLAIPPGGGSISMKGQELFKVAVRSLTESVVRATESQGLKVSDLDWIVPHQANARILEAVAKRLQVPLSRFPMNLERCGNTSAATVPTVFDEAVRDGRIQRGQLICMTTFGAGLTYGANLFFF